MRYALIDSSNTVVNIIEWDERASWSPPSGCSAVPLIEGGIGWSFVDGQFIPPIEPPV